MLLPFQGDFLYIPYTQGATLGQELLPLQGVWGMPYPHMFLPDMRTLVLWNKELVTLLDIECLIP